MPEPAYAFYRVERETSDSTATRGAMLRNVFRKSGKLLRQPIARRIPRMRKDHVADLDVTVVVRDVVRLRDRSGAVVYETTLDRRDEGEALEHQITSDLIALDLEGFRRKYRIANG